MFFVCFLMIRRPPRSSRTDTLFPYTTLFRSDIPVILLTARDETVDRVVGLEAGADDYLGKPFDPRELLARIEAVLRRKKGASALSKDKPVAFGPFVFDPTTRQLLRDKDRKSVV